MRIFGVLLLAVVVAAVGWRWYTSSTPEQRPDRAPGVVLHELSEQNVTESLQAIGTTRSFEAIELTSTVTERVIAMPMTEGRAVTKGTVLVELEKAEEQALLAGAQVELVEHQREFARIEDLVRKRSVPSSELDKRQSLIDGAKARIAEMKARVAERTLTAPFDGVLGLRNLSVGALARPGDVITTLDAIDQLHVDFELPEKHLSRVRVNQKISALSPAYPERAFTGIIETLDSRIDPVSRSLKVRATLDNDQHLLRPGMLLTVDIISSNRQALMVPEQAVFMRGEQHYVYIVDSENTAAERPVTIGIRQKGIVEIIDGLAPGDQIVLQGLLKVKPGSKVSPQDEQWRSNPA